MQTYRYTLRPLSAFGTPLAGDTLFGQLCWTLHHRLGNARLKELLHDYTNGRPFVVVSDAMPAGHVPLPQLPVSAWPWTAATDALDRKTLKKKKWLPLAGLAKPLDQWQSSAQSDAQVAPQSDTPIERAQPHNTINRRTGTTGQGQFAPFAMRQTWFHPATQFDLYIAVDESRLSLTDLFAALDAMGATGFGRDASTGLGKFVRVGDDSAVSFSSPSGANSYLTLGPCAPQGLGYCPVRSTYQVATRFGRHGDAAVQSGQPFKRPVLLAKAGAVFWPEAVDPTRHFIGQGLGGVGNPVSLAMPETVQQGYAPVIAIHRSLEATL
jgi:CRISPR-associated protein Csm4